MESKLIPISEAAARLGLSIDTLRRWDESGKLRATRKSPGGTRYYSEKNLDIFLHELFKMAYEWATNSESTEIPSPFYSPDSSIFQARLIKMQNLLANMPSATNILSLLVAITGEIGNNSFDHNIGNWPDKAGIFYGYDANKGEIVLADRGLGILKTLQRVRPELNSHKDALRVAFTEMISGRAPEERGNGLKFVRKVITENPINLQFQSGDAELIISKESSDLDITKSKQSLRGCIALIKF
ncbi:MAG: MerR family DNA-binding transcriptional regulator [Patescibacteria group bacterium]